jgi:hypothetical protein
MTSELITLRAADVTIESPMANDIMRAAVYALLVAHCLAA